MKKIPTIFKRDMTRQPALVVNEWHPECLWVRDGEGRGTVKWDGTSCLLRDGRLYKRRELRPGDQPPADFESCGTDSETGKTVGWVPVGDGPDDKWHMATSGLWPSLLPGTYELVGPKVNGNRHGLEGLMLLPHGGQPIDAPREFFALGEWLAGTDGIEGVVWHHPDGRMAKIKKRDFGHRW